MPVSDGYLVYKDVYFGVSSYDIGVRSPAIAIPLVAFGIMSDAEIGECARSLVDEARYMCALEIADRLGSSDIPEDYAYTNPEDVALLTAYAERNQKFSITLSAIQCAKEAYDRWLVRQEKKTAGIPTDEEIVRSQLQKIYARTFLKLGRRDGFSCQQCASSLALEIDHIKPVSKGGTNVLTNLQLLCEACNGKKSDKE